MKTYPLTPMAERPACARGTSRIAGHGAQEELQYAEMAPGWEASVGQASAQSPRCSIHCPRPTCVGVATRCVCLSRPPAPCAWRAASAVCGPRSDLREVGWRGAAAGTWQRSAGRGSRESERRGGEGSYRKLQNIDRTAPRIAGSDDRIGKYISIQGDPVPLVIISRIHTTTYNALRSTPAGQRLSSVDEEDATSRRAPKGSANSE